MHKQIERTKPYVHSLEDATSVLDQSDLKQVSYDLRNISGKLMREIETRLNENNPNDLDKLFQLYWQSLINLNLIEQRAMAFITSASADIKFNSWISSNKVSWK